LSIDQQAHLTNSGVRRVRDLRISVIDNSSIPQSKIDDSSPMPKKLEQRLQGVVFLTLGDFSSANRPLTLALHAVYYKIL
jgi:hypothetical protein